MAGPVESLLRQTPFLPWAISVASDKTPLADTVPLSAECLDLQKKLTERKRLGWELVIGSLAITGTKRATDYIETGTFFRSEPDISSPSGIATLMSVSVMISGIIALNADVGYYEEKFIGQCRQIEPTASNESFKSVALPDEVRPSVWNGPSPLPLRLAAGEGSNILAQILKQAGEHPVLTVSVLLGGALLIWASQGTVLLVVAL